MARTDVKEGGICRWERGRSSSTQEISQNGDQTPAKQYPALQGVLNPDRKDDDLNYHVKLIKSSLVWRSS